MLYSCMAANAYEWLVFVHMAENWVAYLAEMSQSSYLVCSYSGHTSAVYASLYAEVGGYLAARMKIGGEGGLG